MSLSRLSTSLQTVTVFYVRQHWTARYNALFHFICITPKKVNSASMDIMAFGLSGIHSSSSSPWLRWAVPFWRQQQQKIPTEYWSTNTKTCKFFSQFSKIQVQQQFSRAVLYLKVYLFYMWAEKKSIDRQRERKWERGTTFCDLHTLFHFLTNLQCGMYCLNPWRTSPADNAKAVSMFLVPLNSTF